jgi:hypothetical protein
LFAIFFAKKFVYLPKVIDPVIQTITDHEGAFAGTRERVVLLLEEIFAFPVGEPKGEDEFEQGIERGSFLADTMSLKDCFETLARS